MKIYLGSDHAGFDTKEKLLLRLSQLGYQPEDIGSKTLDPADDYPQFAYLAVTKLLGDEDNDAKAILLCGSGQGMCMTANRVRGVRAATAWDEASAKASRNDDNANVLCLPARWLNADQALQIAETWLKTPFSGLDRHTRRVNKIDELW